MSEESKINLDFILKLSENEHPQIIAILASQLPSKELKKTLLALPFDLSVDIFRRLYHQPVISKDNLKRILIPELEYIFKDGDIIRPKFQIELENIFFQFPEDIQRKFILKLIKNDPVCAKFLIEKSEKRFEISLKKLIREVKKESEYSEYEEMDDKDVERMHRRLLGETESDIDETSGEILSQEEIDQLLKICANEDKEEELEEVEEEKEERKPTFSDETLIYYGEKSIELMKIWFNNLKDKVDSPYYKFVLLSIDELKLFQLLYSISKISPMWLFLEDNNNPVLLVDISLPFAHEIISSVFGVYNTIYNNNDEINKKFSSSTVKLLNKIMNNTFIINQIFNTNEKIKITYYDDPDKVEAKINIPKDTPVLTVTFEVMIGRIHSQLIGFGYFPTLQLENK